jgi:predicted RecB family nuclease
VCVWACSTFPTPLQSEIAQVTRMKITSNLFEAYLKCPNKCWLRSIGETSADNTYSEWVKAHNESYRMNETRRLVAESPNEEAARSPEMKNLRAAKWRLASNLAIRAQIDSAVLESKFQAVERVSSDGRSQNAQFIPIRFAFPNKLSWDDKLLLAFDALVLSKLLCSEVSWGKIVHGDNHTARTVKTAALVGKVRKIIGKIATLLASDSPPDLVLNRHCVECEFRDRCRQKVIEKDDLSLLPNMTERERRKLNSKGIFTVKQLSYTFRARRRPKSFAGKREKYHHSLKALAIRERKIHIVGSPELTIEGTPVYLDVEGIPDREFYYLVGLRVKTAEQVIQYSFWADSVYEEKRIWNDFLGILSGIENPVLVHYGSYETTFLKRMCCRYGDPVKDSPLAKIIKSAVNLLSFIFAQIYFPTYSNSLKEVVSSLGFAWSKTNLSGPNSIACRLDWELSGNSSLKRRLLSYNEEDCNGIEILTGFLYKLCRGKSSETSQTAIEAIHVDRMKPLPPFTLINKDGAALPEFKAINRAAYWDYQRQRVYVRSSRVLKKACQKALGRKVTRLPVKQNLKYSDPVSCTFCGSADIFEGGTTDIVVHDIRFMQTGAKGWVTRHICENWYCAKCQRLVRPPGTSEFAFRKYGPHLRAFAVYQLIQLRISGITVAKLLNQLFHFDVTGSNISTFKSDFAKRYTKTVGELTERIARGSLVHADETKARMIGKSGFVWVLASLEDVVFVYSDTREGDMVHALLKDFRGVLVSDFYAVYDAFKCPQQKCLIHLMRDINDDMHRHPTMRS